MKLLYTIVPLIFFLGEYTPDNNEYDKWLNHYQLEEVDFKSKCAQGNLEFVWDMYFPIANSYREMLKGFFIYSPDSAFFIDLDSYSLAVERIDGKLVSYGFEADSKVQLVRTKDNMAANILFCGPEYIIESAVWISPNRLYLLGFIDKGERYCQPCRWIVDLNQNSITNCLAAKEIPREKVNYRIEERLNEIEFK